ncbi:MAG: acyl-CoA dehydrogenase family protein, partial [Actinomycetota bacterium]
MEDLLPGDDDPRRAAVRGWIAAHPDPTPLQLAEAGWVAPHWPEPWGLGADPLHQLLIDDEFARAGIKRPSNQIGIGWAAPTIIHAGTEEQKKRYVLPALTGEEIWCQLFSEPGAGSDLASLSTRAERDGDRWIVNGQKVWCSGGRASNWGILMARTKQDGPKHEGISFFLCPMDAPGIEVRPLRQMTGEAEFDEVFFTDAEIPADSLIGPVHGGWGVGMAVLTNERGHIGASIIGLERRIESMAELGRGAGLDATGRQHLARQLSRGIAFKAMARTQGPVASTASSLMKLGITEMMFEVAMLRGDIAGAAAMLEGPDAMGMLAAPGGRIAGGSSQV